MVDKSAMRKTVYIDTEYIQLDALMKWARLVMSGGEAKMCIQEGDVEVNGVTETRRSRKVRPGDTVIYAGTAVSVARKEGDSGASAS